MVDTLTNMQQQYKQACTQDFFFCGGLRQEFYENPANGSWVVPCEQTDRHIEAKSCFCKFVNATKKETYCYITYSLGMAVTLYLVTCPYFLHLSLTTSTW
jgi:hypothetical protein